jgi:hypothetical protein
MRGTLRPQLMRDSVRQPIMDVYTAIKRAEAILPGTAAPKEELDPRWERILDVGQYLQSDPEPVWDFISRWGSHEDEDLRTAISLCLLEHLLGYHFDAIFPRVERRAAADERFADTFRHCRMMGQAEALENAARWNALLQRLS